MKFYASSLVLVAYLTTASIAVPLKPIHETVNVDVAIIGGGASGIHAAIHLKDAGAKIAVIEKKDQIGGHAESYVNAETKAVANIGVVLFENSKTVEKYFDRLGVDTTLRNPVNTTTETKQYDFSLGIPIPPQDASEAAATAKAIAAAMQAYIKNVIPKYPWIDQGYTFVPSPVPEELLQPFGKFAEQNNFTALLPLIAQFNWYPGRITEIPTLYGIKKFGPGLINSIVNGFIVPKSGNARTVYEAATRELKDELYLNSNIEKVHRKEDGIVVTVKQDGKRVTFNARKLLVAIPQTLKNVAHFDLRPAEKALFSKFSTFGYVAGVANIPGVDYNLQNVGALTRAHTPVIPGSNGYNIPPGFSGQFLLGVAFDHDDYTLEQAKTVMRKELASLAIAKAVPADTAKNVKFPKLANHAPFELHVSAKEIGDGFFEDLRQLEGERNTYWTGAAFADHNSGLIWEWNEAAVLPAMKKDLGLEGGW